MARDQRGLRRPARDNADLSLQPDRNVLQSDPASSIGGDAVRLWLVARGGAGWRAATYSIFVDRAIGLIALAIVIVASLPWSYRLIDDLMAGRRVVLDFAALAAGAGFLILGRLPWPWLKRWWATHHLHACSVIANRLIFSRERGPKLAALSLLVHVLTRHRLVRCAIDRSMLFSMTSWNSGHD